MKTMLIAITAAAAVPLGACSQLGLGQDRGYVSSSGYDPYRDYRARNTGAPVVLGNNDTIYRGSDGRYYCRRSDGTTGLVVGAAAGGVLGNIIAPGGSKLLGTIIGGAAGAAIGREVERGEVKCQ